MKLIAYAVYDSKVCSFSRPCYAVRDDALLRSFENVINDPRLENEDWKNHPEDFQLFRIGEFDDATAAFKSCPPVAICTLDSLKRPEKVETVN